MSTGPFEPGSDPNLLQFTGGDQRNVRNQRDGTDYYQFNNPGDGPSNLQSEGWNIPRGQTRDFAFPTDGQGYPVVPFVINNNGGEVNIYMAGGNGYSDAACRAQQARKLADMTSGRYDNYDDRRREEWGPEYNRLSDFRREALIRDGQEQDRMIRSNYRQPDPYYDRQFSRDAYYRPGRDISYTHGGSDGFSTYYENGPSDNRLPPWVNDDCFGTGVDRNGYRLFRDLLNTGLSYDIARRHARNGGGNRGYDQYGRGNDRYAGSWDYRHDNRMNPIEYMLLDNTIRGNRWDRNSNRYYTADNNVSYRHGGSDGFTTYDSVPSWDRYGSGNQWAGVLQDGLNTYLAYDIARRSVPRYESHRNVDSYYANRDNFSDRGHQIASTREYYERRNEQRAAQIRANRERYTG